MRLTRLNQLIRGREMIDGIWSLTRNHELQYRRRGKEKEIILTGELIRAQPEALVFRIAESSFDEDIVQREFALRGRWQADDQNRLSFLVERERGRNDALTLQGGWEVDPRLGLIYRYDRVDLQTKRKQIRTLTFRGYWDLTEGSRLTYVLDTSRDSVFRFRGTFQTSSILAKDGLLRYQVGIEVEGRRRLQTVTLFGKWKMSRDLALEFEVAHPGGARRTIRFGATYVVNSRASISALLMDREGESLGFEVILTRDFFSSDGQAFVRLRKSLEETAVEGGLRFHW